MASASSKYLKVGIENALASALGCVLGCGISVWCGKEVRAPERWVVPVRWTSVECAAGNSGLNVPADSVPNFGTMDVTN